MSNKNTPVTAEQVLGAKNDYDLAKKQVNAAISANQSAMRKFQIERNAETKAAYDATRAAHKASIAHIKKVRPIYKNLKTKFEAQIAATAPA